MIGLNRRNTTYETGGQGPYLYYLLSGSPFESLLAPEDLSYITDLIPARDIASPVDQNDIKL